MANVGPKFSFVPGPCQLIFWERSIATAEGSWVLPVGARIIFFQSPFESERMTMPSLAVSPAVSGSDNRLRMTSGGSGLTAKICAPVFDASKSRRYSGLIVVAGVWVEKKMTMTA